MQAVTDGQFRPPSIDERCGTFSGVKRHVRNHEAYCLPCKVAASEAAERAERRELLNRLQIEGEIVARAAGAEREMWRRWEAQLDRAIARALVKRHYRRAV